MRHLFAVETGVTLVIIYALLAVKIFAFISSLTYSAEAYVAAGKLTKATWCIMLGLFLAVSLAQLGFTLSLISTIAALVFILDVRPALSGLTRR